MNNWLTMMKINKKKLAFLLITVSLFALMGFLICKIFFSKSNTLPEKRPNKIEDLNSESREKFFEKEEKNPGDSVGLEEKIPERIKIKVPFTSQAPWGIWDERHQEACEEASLVMIYYYLQKRELNKDLAEKEIQSLINFQIRKYGNFKDSNVAQTVIMARDFYGIENLKIVYDFTKEELKKELAAGNPIIVPAAGRELNNPYYTAPGPLYHMLVVTGYSGNQIITNDPGTRRGEDYRYHVDVLHRAIHDFPGEKEKIKEGRKAMIVIKR